MVGSGQIRSRRGRPAGAGGLPGFTLFEVLIVLIVVAMASALVLPRLADSIPKVKLHAAAKSLAASLRYARGRAATETTVMAVDFDRPGGSIAIQALPSENGLWRPLTNPSGDEGSEVRRYRLPEGIRMSLYDFDGKPAGQNLSVFFFPAGNSSGGKIVLTNEKGRKVLLTIDFLIGEVRIAAA